MLVSVVVAVFGILNLELVYVKFDWVDAGLGSMKARARVISSSQRANTCVRFGTSRHHTDQHDVLNLTMIIAKTTFDRATPT
jgi:hypothetical protein